MNEVTKINGWEIVDNNGQPWITGEEVGRHLQYDNPKKAISNIYSRNKKSFIEGEDSVTLKMRATDGKLYNTRVYSEKGVLKLIRYSSQPIADKIMDEVFKVFLHVKNNRAETKIVNAPQLAAAMFESNMKIAEIIQIPRSFALVETTKMVEEKTGLDYSKMIEQSPIMDRIEDKDEFLEPSAIGERLGISGKEVNKFLGYIGWQNRVNKQWMPTEYCKKEKYCFRHQWKLGSKSGYNYKWCWQIVSEEWKKSGWK